MKDYRKGSHTVWDCKYHLVWITKYRYPILVGKEPGTVGYRARELLREIARSLELTIHAGAINREHVHMLVLAEFPSLRKRYWGQHLWARGYWVASSGNVTDEVWKKYIEGQQPEPPDDDFKVV